MVTRGHGPRPMCPSMGIRGKKKEEYLTPIVSMFGHIFPTWPELNSETKHDTSGTQKRDRMPSEYGFITSIKNAAAHLFKKGSERKHTLPQGCNPVSHLGILRSARLHAVRPLTVHLL